MHPKLKAKNLLFCLLDKMPGGMDFKLYHFAQNILNRISLEERINSSAATYQQFIGLSKKLNIPIEDRRMLEIGSGWLPLLPYFFKFLGKAGKIFTYDLNEHYNINKVRSLNEEFAGRYKIEISGLDTAPYQIPEGIEYLPNINITQTKLPLVDLVFSRFVLEHVKPEDLLEMHKKFKNELEEGTHLVHFISPSDHRAYVDKSLSLQDFLQYSEEEWNRKHTKFDYHNRWRLPQYLALFSELDLEIVHLDYDVPKEGSDSYKKFKNVKLHQDFKNWSEEELMAGSIIIVLKI